VSLTNNKNDGYWLADNPRREDELIWTVRLGVSGIFGHKILLVFNNCLPDVRHI
jgi:hypothetical protein